MDIGIGTPSLLNRLFYGGDIDTRQKDEFIRSVRAFYDCAYRYALKNLPHSDKLLNNAQFINWEGRVDVNGAEGIEYFVKGYY